MRFSRREGVVALAGLPLLAARAAEDDEDWLPNVFISPCGEAFRARPGAPYPSIDWFHQANKAKDGKLTKAEFVADADAFFQKLDINHDGVLSPPEIYRYEHRIAPEILGFKVKVSLWDQPRLWLAQIDRPGEIDPGGSVPNEPSKPKPLDESTQGAAPYSLFDEPEPVMAADLNFDGIIRRANFSKLAGIHFATLDRQGRGFLAFDDLPTTPMQKELFRRYKGRTGPA